eukprot:TRINITY_DN5211_c0_g1_i2.p1 TRINITY_DN5211_c0_g1~~TRINITY_DN5211_c0_g1_i2.p1  ORF type:complete len:309 (+),score=49.17 TRINITY_DN5211_c0_g1_i2:77-928(+)
MIRTAHVVVVTCVLAIAGLSSSVGVLGDCPYPNSISAKPLYNVHQGCCETIEMFELSFVPGPGTVLRDVEFEIIWPQNENSLSLGHTVFYPYMWNIALTSNTYDYSHGTSNATFKFTPFGSPYFTGGNTYTNSGFFASGSSGNPDHAPIIRVTNCSSPVPPASSTTSGSTSSTTTTTSSGPIDNQCKASVAHTFTQSWNGGGQASVTIQNTGQKAITGLTFSLTGSSGGVQTWNTVSQQEEGHFSPASYYLPINVGQTASGIGYNYSGNKPTIQLVSVTCSSA